MPAPTPGAQRATAAQKIAEAKKIQDDADAVNKQITDDEEKQVYGLLAEADALQKDADRREQILTRFEKLDEVLPRKTDADKPSDARASLEARDTEREKKHGFRSMGEFASCVQKAMDPSIGIRDKRLDFNAAISGMSQQVPADGGFVVPPAFSTKIWDGLNAGSTSLLSMTDTYTVDGESITFPANAETSRATGSRYGGIQAYWASEGAQITPSKPKFRQMKLEPQELYVLVYATDKLLRNSPVALDQYINRAAIDEINFMTGAAIFSGDGAGKPKGLVNSGCVVTVSKESGQIADTIVDANIAKMWGRLHVNARSSAVWLINQDCEQQLDMMAQRIFNIDASNVVGGSFSPLYDRQANTLKGRPVISCEFSSSIGDLNDIVLVDMRSYATGVRGGIDSAMSIHLRFDYAETAFRFIFSVDGQTWLQSALTPFKGSNTLSTVINLQAR